ncbi:CD209 antigen-like [Vidua chalybeata]|uniref:CD209 antigen-like n=1 Tax=Vidua chalybeata TaxID=81927 RepID=UPI0023A7B2D9|nr:CD209 antigen-like [Vidua chalybeata]
MAQQETYGNWLGPKRLQRQPGIYSVAGKMSPVGDFRPASPDSFEDDYDDVSMAGSERGPPAKGVYLLAGPPQEDPAPKDPEGCEPKLGNSEPKLGNSERKFGNSKRKFGNSGLVATLALLVATLGLAWGGLLAVAIGKHQELQAELELLKSNFSAIWDSLQQEQTRLHFGIQQHQLEQQELADLLCQALGGSRRCGPGWRPHGSSCYSFSRDLLCQALGGSRRCGPGWRPHGSSCYSFSRDLLCQALGGSRRCGPGWRPHGSSCYSFSRDALSWGRARSACEDLGAHLAVVSDEAEQLFLVESSNSSSSYWLGVTDAEQEGKWRWVTGEEPQFGFWDVWQRDPQQELKDCGALGPKGRWVSARCSEPLRWVCERPGHC